MRFLPVVYVMNVLQGGRLRLSTYYFFITDLISDGVCCRATCFDYYLSDVIPTLYESQNIKLSISSSNRK